MQQPAHASPHDSDSEEEEFVGEWNLGFVEPPQKPTDLLRHRFPSKVGGRPAWLDPLHLPTPDQLTCKATGKQLQFLLQVYAPVDENPAAFHRSIFVFTSPQGDKLAEPGAVRAFRCQLPLANPFYSSEPPRKKDVRPRPLGSAEAAAALSRDPWRVAEHEQGAAAATAAAGGSASSSSSGAAAEQREQSGGAAAPEEQQAGGAPQQGQAQGEQPGQGQQPGREPALFPELELLVEPEEEDEGGGEREEQLRELLQQYKLRTAQEGEYTEEELPGDLVDSIEAGVDEEQRHFAAFSARIAREPSQCLRYCFEPGAAPLWPSTKRVPAAADIPRCERCGAERRFEFQVMPQLLNYLEQDPSDPASPDWGTIAVYTCSRSCSSSDSGSSSSSGGGAAGSEPQSAYAEEFVWVQPS